MNKLGYVLIVICGVIGCYFLVTIVVPFLADVTVTTNATMDASSNMSMYPGTSGFLLSTPWILFFVPAAIGIVLIIVKLRER